MDTLLPQDLIYPMDVFKGGPGRAVGQQGGGHRWEGTALALRAGGGYGTVEQRRLTGYGWADRGENQHTHAHTLTAFRIPLKN
jgi:hypothetical protein